jgi:hypothetical protein
MSEHPNIPELIEAVREYLEVQAIPNLTGHTAFHGRVAVNVLNLVLRALGKADNHELAETQRLKALLGKEGSRDQLNQALASAIHTDAIAWDDGQLIAHLRQTSLDRLSVDNPNYTAFKRAKPAQAKT